MARPKTPKKPPAKPKTPPSKKRGGPKMGIGDFMQEQFEKPKPKKARSR